jgi:hypothetical protein
VIDIMNLDPYSPLIENSQEAARETGLTLRAIIEQLGGQPGFLFGIAAAILSILALVATAFVPSSPEFVWFPFAILLFGLALVIIETRRAYSEVKSTEEEAPPASPIRYVSPVMVTASDPVSVGVISSQVLMEPRGGISLWIYVDQFERGIRNKTRYNKYLIAHDTNGGDPIEVHGKPRYINSFALSWGPTDWANVKNPGWKIELSNNRGETKRYSFADSRSISAGDTRPDEGGHIWGVRVRQLELKKQPTHQG